MQGKEAKALRVLKVKVKHILWLKKKVILFLVKMGNSMEQHRASIGAFNASSKRRRRIFSSRSSNLVSIAALINLQLLLFGVLGLLNSELLLSTALMIGFLVSIILSSWKWKRVSFLDPKMPLLLRL